MAKSPTGTCRPASIGFIAGARLARNRPSGLSSIGKVLGATKEPIFESDARVMNRQMRLKIPASRSVEFVHDLVLAAAAMPYSTAQPSAAAVMSYIKSSGGRHEGIGYSRRRP